MFTFTDCQKEQLLLWATELEKTQYSQTCRTLRYGDGFCCLGIYCNMISPLSWVKIPKQDTDLEKDEYEFIMGDEISTGGLSPSLANSLGMTEGSLHGDFVFMNDELKYTFDRIAKEVRYLVENGEFSEETSTAVKI